MHQHILLKTFIKNLSCQKIFITYFKEESNFNFYIYDGNKRSFFYGLWRNLSFFELEFLIIKELNLDEINDKKKICKEIIDNLRYNNEIIQLAEKIKENLVFLHGKIFFKDFIYDINSKEIIEYSKEFFVKNKLEYNPIFTKKKNSTPIFDKLVNDWSKELDKIEKGVLISIIHLIICKKIYELKLIIFLTDDPNTGKSLFTRFLCSLICRNNIRNSSFTSVSGRFETSSYVNKTLVIFNDTRSEISPIVEENLRILSGMDFQNIDKKFLSVEEPLFFQGCLLITSNELPTFSSATGDLPDRRINIKFLPLKSKEEKNLLDFRIEPQTQSFSPFCILIDEFPHIVGKILLLDIEDSKKKVIKLKRNQLLASFDEQLLLKSFLVDTVRFSQEKKDRIAFGKKTPGYKKRDKSFSYKPELFEKYRDFLYGINEDTKKVTLNKFQNGVKQILSVNTP